MKNSKSTLSKALSQKLSSQFRILITGDTTHKEQTSSL